MRRILTFILALIAVLTATAQQERFCIASKGTTAPIVVDKNDCKGVLRAVNNLSDDIRKVTGTASTVVSSTNAANGSIIVGTIGQSRLIDKLIKQKKLDVKKIKGHWEGYVIDNVDGNLVIAGNDRRGTIYGIYEVSRQIGVSPWYWMADAPVAHKDELYFDSYQEEWPAVKYRGIFINDEWPSFGTWCQKHFGGVNSKAYEKIFELLLRLKANYFWPAMWATAFNEDDPESPRVADEMGIVMGTSHHEPMMRSHQEYLHRKEQVGPWDYATNKERVDQFFREGMERNKAYDNLVTIGMRGDGDVAMGKGGLGLYYHIDMNGGPWNDRWVNTTTVPKLREQLNQAYQSGIDRIWIINVGDLKPKEMPISFIMDYAWKPERTQSGQEEEWLRAWTHSVFAGLPTEITNECAHVIAQYSKLNLLRKPEVQVPGLFNYEEMLLLNNQWQRIVLRCEALKEQIPAEAQDAFYQLVYYPAVASAGVAMMYNAATMGSRETVNELMKKDQRLTDYYNKVLAGGKWDGMMLDNHIGYTKWSIPDKNTNPMDLGYKVSHDLGASNDTKEYSIGAKEFTNSDEGWIFLPNLGRYEGCMGAADVMKSYPNGDGPVLEYDINLSPVDGKGTVAIGILPTQDIYPARGLRLGVQIDDQPMQTIDARQGLHDEFGEYTPKNLAQSKKLKPLPPHNNLLLSGWKDGRKMLRRDEVFDNIRWLEVNLNNVTSGKHKLRLIMIDPEIVVENIVVNPDNNRYSYFGKQ